MYKRQAKEQSSSTAENPIIEVTASKKKKNKLPIFITIFILILVAGGTYYYENYINISNEKFLPLNNKLDYKELSIVLEQKLYQLPQFDTMRYYLIIEMCIRDSVTSYDVRIYTMLSSFLRNRCV